MNKSTNSWQITERPILKLRPDPTQPRSGAKKYALEDMTESISAGGLIHPIEIDEHNVIVTGELRWMAARQAGLKTIPCRVISGLSQDERLQRQLIENLQRHDMAPSQIATALKRLSGQGMSNVTIGKLLGKNHTWVSDHLAVLDVPQSLRSGIDNGKIALRIAKKVGGAPAHTQKELIKKIIDQEMTHDETRDLTSAIDRKPEATKKILAINMSEPGAHRKLQKLAPDNRTIARDSVEVGTAFLSLMADLNRFLSKHAPSELAPLYIPRVKTILPRLIAELSEWNRELN